MLGFVFGLNARLRRLQFFLATIVLAIVMTAICFAVAMSVLRTSPGMVRPEDLPRHWAIWAAVGFFAVTTFTLYSMRFRDMGWDPVCVIPAWIALMIVDHVVATRFPHLAVGHEQAGTIVGGLVNLALLLALLFWPSGEGGGAYDAPQPPRASARSSVSNDRLARITQSASRPY